MKFLILLALASFAAALPQQYQSNIGSPADHVKPAVRPPLTADNAATPDQAGKPQTLPAPLSPQTADQPAPSGIRPLPFPLNGGSSQESHENDKTDDDGRYKRQDNVNSATPDQAGKPQTLPAPLSPQTADQPAPSGIRPLPFPLNGGSSQESQEDDKTDDDARYKRDDEATSSEDDTEDDNTKPLSHFVAILQKKRQDAEAAAESEDGETTETPRPGIPGVDYPIVEPRPDSFYQNEDNEKSTEVPVPETSDTHTIVKRQYDDLFKPDDDDTDDEALATTEAIPDSDALHPVPVGQSNYDQVSSHSDDVDSDDDTYQSRAERQMPMQDDVTRNFLPPKPDSQTENQSTDMNNSIKQKLTEYAVKKWVRKAIKPLAKEIINALRDVKRQNDINQIMNMPLGSSYGGKLRAEDVPVIIGEPAREDTLRPLISDSVLPFSYSYNPYLVDSMPNILKESTAVAVPSAFLAKFLQNLPDFNFYSLLFNHLKEQQTSRTPEIMESRNDNDVKILDYVPSKPSSSLDTSQFSTLSELGQFEDYFDLQSSPFDLTDDLPWEELGIDPEIFDEDTHDDVIPLNNFNNIGAQESLQNFLQDEQVNSVQNKIEESLFSSHIHNDLNFNHSTSQIALPIDTNLTGIGYGGIKSKAVIKNMFTEDQVDLPIRPSLFTDTNDDSLSSRIDNHVSASQLLNKIDRAHQPPVNFDFDNTRQTYEDTATKAEKRNPIIGSDAFLSDSGSYNLKNSGDLNFNDRQGYTQLFSKNLPSKIESSASVGSTAPDALDKNSVHKHQKKIHKNYKEKATDNFKKDAKNFRRTKNEPNVNKSTDKSFPRWSAKENLDNVKKIGNDIKLEKQTARRNRPKRLNTPKNSFSCVGKERGYHPANDSNCQIFHRCVNEHRRFSFTCPPGTRYDSSSSICRHARFVPC